VEPKTKVYTAKVPPITTITTPPTIPKTFVNPILDNLILEPSVIKFRGFYYMVHARNSSISILKSRKLSNFRQAERKKIFKMPNANGVVRNPKIYSISGEVYVYFSMADDANESNHRLHVLKCVDTNYSLLGNWSKDARLVYEDDIIDRDGAILQYGNGDLYFIWSGKPQVDQQWNLYIARMENPMKLLGPRMLLRMPTYDWEKRRYASIRAPFVLHYRGRAILIFSASSTEDPDCCLGMMGIDGEKDAMVLSNWWNDVDHCVFNRNDTETVWGPGYASFVNSPDESETWMVYSACYDINDCVNRIVRARRIGWKANGPRFPFAVSAKRPLDVPRGEFGE